MRKIVVEKQFKRDLKKAKKQGKDLKSLDAIIHLLRNDEALPTSKRDHRLTGDFRGYRECHISPDWLLIYKQIDDELRLARLGSHSELFKG